MLCGSAGRLKKFDGLREAIQKCYLVKGIANVTDFGFRVVIAGKTIIAEGGIGITDSPDHSNEIEIEVARISHELISDISE